MKIFRKIRQQLAAENNVAKYMRYAIGEILQLKIYATDKCYFHIK